MTDAEVAERVIKAEERAKSNSHRLDKLEPVVTEIHNMSRNMAVMIEEVKHTNENLKDTNDNLRELKEDVEEIKKEPSARLTQIKTAIIAALATALVGGIAGAVLMLM